MKLLFTGDWQLSVHNIATVRVMLDEVFELIAKYKIDAVVNLGDWKEVYHPISGDVLNCAIETCVRFKERKIPYLVLEGNHDRYGPHSDTHNWFPALQEAGAVTFDTAGVHFLKSMFKTWKYDAEIFMLPFCNSPKKFRRYADELAAQVKNPERSILCFHQDIKGCKLNLSVTSKDSPVNLSDLHPEKYLYCIGGHIHLQQNVKENVWYAGTPFPMDWGEANQRKGYLFVDTGTKEIKTIYSKIPRMYDEQGKGFEAAQPKDWKGARVRIHITCDESVPDLSLVIADATETAQQKYPGAKIVPEIRFKDTITDDVVLGEDNSDLGALKAYVTSTCTETLKDDTAKIIAYLKYVLSTTTTVRHNQKGWQFLRARGHNFLSFRDVEIDYTEPGLTLVTGINKDWENTSNASGKTSLLALPSVALEGRTFKGQTHDRWARKDANEKAFCELDLKSPDDRIFTVYRSRNPAKLQLKIDGKDRSVGRNPNEVQKQIEQLTGFNWLTLSNGLYVDQQEVTSLLDGTEAQRREILGRFQNLERFVAGHELVKKHIKKHETYKLELENRLLLRREHKTTLETFLESLVNTSTNVSDIQNQLAVLRKDEKRFKAVLDGVPADLEKQMKTAEKKCYDIEKQLTKVQTDRKALEIFLKKTDIDASTCPVCLQRVDKKKLAQHRSETEAQIEALYEKEEPLHSFSDVAHEEYTHLQDQYAEREHTHNKLFACTREIKTLTASLQSESKHDDTRKKNERELAATKREIATLKAVIEDAYQQSSFYEYCASVLDKKGLPAFLNKQLVPRLNKAAEFYSEKFTESHLQLRFTVDDDGHFKLNVLNPNGGENLEDQSKGEKKLLGLIASFALHDLVSTNLLLLDEPADGLDEKNSLRFARALKAIAPRFGTVLLTTHNQIISAELSGQKQIRVIKRNNESKAVLIQ